MWFNRGEKDGAIRWLVVCLGNPGEKYRRTRHNVGFMTADVIAARKSIKIDRFKYKALYAVSILGGEKAIIMKPQTYMNLSGQAVRAMAAWHKIPVERIIVISDDVALPAGKLRIRRSGSAGGHNGLKSVISSCGSEDFPRIKIGVDSPDNENYGMVNWVLGVITGPDKEKIAESIEKAADALEEIISCGVDAAMNKYNG